MTEPFIISADQVLTIDPEMPATIAEAGVVVSDGRILAVGERAELRRKFGDLHEERFPGTLMPGLVNAHTHLELSYLSAEKLAATANTRGGMFAQWISQMMKSYPPPAELDPMIRAAALRGAAQCLRNGVTTVGDISRHVQITRPVLKNGPLNVTSFGEIVALGKMRGRLDERLAAAADRSDQTHALRVGVSPHAPYTVERASLESIVQRALAEKLPICMHLSELAEEAEFLRDQSGPLGRDWDVMLKMDILDQHIPAFEGGPIRWAEACGLLAASHALPVLLAHVNYCDDQELAILARSKASVVYCPRTHAYFGHPPHRYRDMLDAGINVCLGTDSLASNPDLSVLREAQLLIQRDGISRELARQMITRRGAAALGVSSELGSLRAGNRADLFVPEAGAVWVNGQPIAQHEG